MNSHLIIQPDVFVWLYQEHLFRTSKHDKAKGLITEPNPFFLGPADEFVFSLVILFFSTFILIYFIIAERRQTGCCMRCENGLALAISLLVHSAYCVFIRGYRFLNDHGWYTSIFVKSACGEQDYRSRMFSW